MPFRRLMIFLAVSAVALLLVLAPSRAADADQTNSCIKCGLPFAASNNQLESEIQTASLQPDGPVQAFTAEANGSFDYTPIAQKSLAEKSRLAAIVLNNLTTRCGSKERVTLTTVTNAPFSGGGDHHDRGRPGNVQLHREAHDHQSSGHSRH